MKIHIIYQFKNGPYGGVNQFLKALKECFEKMGCYEEQIEQADIVLYNSSNATKEVLNAKLANSQLLFVQRMDGPASLITSTNDSRDVIAAFMNKYIADATVYQTDYSKDANLDRGFCRNQFEITIPNAPNPILFYPKSKKTLSEGKVRLIASSWSAHMNKGFETYKYLDNNLDFNRYEMFFVGNTPIEFKNIKKMEAMDSQTLGEMLRSCDIYITASKKDPCSNSLIEAMFCGLPVVALRDGGHPELVGEAGELFDSYEEIPYLLDKICNNYETYSSKMSLDSISEISNKYYNFMLQVVESKEQGKYSAKHYGIVEQIVVAIHLFMVKVKDRIKRKK